MSMGKLLLLIIVFLTSKSAAGSWPSHFQELKVEEAIAGTKVQAEELEEKEEAKWKVEIVHRDKLIINTDHRSRFNARIKRDVKRVASLLLLRRHAYTVEEASFGSDVVSGTAEGSGEYFVRIGIGSPATYQYMVIDSGSDVVWVQCQPCDQCYNQSDPIFNPALSASFAAVPCSSAVCDQLDDSGCHQGRCRYQVSYGDGSYTRGTLALETITLGKTVIRNTAIGCGNLNQGMFVGAAGLLGLGAGPMSFVGQLGGQTGGAFAYCLLSRGTHPPRTRLNISEDLFRVTDLGDGGAVMDTGTAVTRLPTVAYGAFRDAFVAQTTNLPRAAGVSIFDTCYDLNGFVTVRVPTVSFYFWGGQILTLPARNFLIPADDVGTFCFAFAASPSALSIIGNIQQEGIQISVDGANGFLGFGPNVC
uniref:Peptidase A1 domain-containing protein n=1 Tax=Glycine max TaxID=3847 RepID=A0A0R0IKL9_SOYBN